MADELLECGNTTGALNPLTWAYLARARITSATDPVAALQWFERARVPRRGLRQRWRPPSAPSRPCLRTARRRPDRGRSRPAVVSSQRHGGASGLGACSSLPSTTSSSPSPGSAIRRQRRSSMAVVTARSHRLRSNSGASTALPAGSGTCLVNRFDELTETRCGPDRAGPWAPSSSPRSTSGS